MALDIDTRMAASADNILRAPPAGMTPRQCLEFFVLAPGLMGLFFGMAGLGSQQFQSVWLQVAYTTLHAMLAWIFWGCGSKLTALVFRPWKPPLPFVLVVGHVVGGFLLWRPVRELFNQPFLPYLVNGSEFPPFWPPAHWDIYVVYSLQGCTLWVLLNWLDFNFRGVPRFGFSPPPRRLPLIEPFAGGYPVTDPPTPGTDSPSPASSPAGGAPARPLAPAPRLAQRLPAELKGAEILVLEAEEHYIKVHTSKGNTLLLMRLTDAMNEMDPLPGLRVHRSFWVSRDAVVRVFRRQRRWFLQVSNGLEIPVSRSYRVIVQNAGFPGGTGLAEDAGSP